MGCLPWLFTHGTNGAAVSTWTKISYCLIHWGQVTHICVGKLAIIGSDIGLLPGWYQAIIWTNAGILSIGPLTTNLSEILIGIHKLSFKKMHVKMSAKWRQSCLGLSVLDLYNCISVKLNSFKCLGLNISDWALTQAKKMSVGQGDLATIFL